MKVNFVSRVGKAKVTVAKEWKKEREGSISPEKWTCQRESGGGRGNGRARNGSAEQKTHFVFWNLAAFSFFQSSVNAQSKVLCDWASSHRHKHSSCLEGYSLWLRILTVFLAIKTIEGFGHKSSYWWGQPSFQCVSVCIFLCMSVGMQYMCVCLSVYAPLCMCSTCVCVSGGACVCACVVCTNRDTWRQPRDWSRAACLALGMVGHTWQGNVIKVIKICIKVIINLITSLFFMSNEYGHHHHHCHDCKPTWQCHKT